MALLHRKFLISKSNKNPNFTMKFDTDGCYSCYYCPDDCNLSPPPPPPPPPPLSSDSSKYQIPMVLILMLCVLGVAFLVLSYLTISRYRNSRSRNPRPPENLTANFVDENQGPILDHPIWFIRTVGLPQSVIDSIASFPYRKGGGLIDGNDCSVCLNDFQQNEMIRLLPKCSHAFHLDCIDTWLRSHMNCPVCRAPIVRVGPGDNSAESSSSSSGSGELESRGETERDGDGPGETRSVTMQVGGVSDEVSTVEKMRVGSDLADRTLRVDSFDRELQPVRRSVSMDL